MKTGRSVLLGALGVVVLLFVAGRVIGTRPMLLEMAHDPAILESERWSAEDRARLRFEAGLPWDLAARALEGRSEQPRERPSRGQLLMFRARTMLRSAWTAAVVIGVLVFLCSPLFGMKESRWRGPRVNRLRWAFIGSGIAALAFAVPEAHHMARLALHVQTAGVFSPPPATPDSYGMTYWWTLIRELGPLLVIAVTGVVAVLIGLWLAGRRRLKTGRVRSALDAVPESHDGVRWVLTGALWMAICVTAYQAFDRWVTYPVLADLGVLPGADGAVAAPDVSGVMIVMASLVSLLDSLAFAAFGIGVMVAVWRIMSRWRPDVAEPLAGEGGLTG